MPTWVFFVSIGVVMWFALGALATWTFGQVSKVGDAGADASRSPRSPDTPAVRSQTG